MQVPVNRGRQENLPSSAKGTTYGESKETPSIAIGAVTTLY